jgi:carboxylesterase type B
MDDQAPLHHPTLNCTLIGKSSPSTIEYRGLKYASIPARWKESSPNDTLSPTPNGVYNATQFGPSCPQKRGAQAWDLTLVGNASLPCDQSQGDGEVMHEFECLTVNVTVPRHTQTQVHGGNRNTNKKLPVFVWIHGGGLSMGANSWPQYSLAAFVAHAASIGKPVIAVSVNYRVGVLGFLASRELDVHGNLGFKDVANAMRWVRRHVGGFGGDAAQVTAAGESAGGIVLSTLMCSQEQGLWDRVVVMSGDVTLRKPRAWAWHEELYGEQIKMLGLDGLGKEERVKRLREWDAETMCQKLPLAQHFCALVDGRWLKEHVDLAVLEDGRRWEHKPAWCREFAVGNTAHDVSPTIFPILSFLPHRFFSSSSAY